MKKLLFYWVLSFCFAISAIAQETSNTNLPQSNDLSEQSPEYFDFWKNGKWVSEITIYNGDTIPEKDHFIVQKMEGYNAFQEDWSIFIGDGEFVKATVMRAFDKTDQQWRLFYVDDISAQIWESHIEENKIYFYKTFRFKNKQFYSRQAWSLRADEKVLRTIERSEDNKNWKMRYWQVFSPHQ